MSCTMTMGRRQSVGLLVYSVLTAENGDADEIDLVLSHSRDEEHASDPKDNPQTNLVGRAFVLC